jgi:hypothetical protein
MPLESNLKSFASFTLKGSALEYCPLIIGGTTSCESNPHFDECPLEIDFGGDNSDSLFTYFAREKKNCFFVEKYFTVSHRTRKRSKYLFIRTNMCSEEHWSA